MKNKLDSLFFNRLFVSERKQIALMADEKSPLRISRRLFATSRSEMGISMCQALMEIMEPQLLLREKEGRKEGIQGAVDTLREFGHKDVEIKRAIMHRYGLLEEEAEEYLWR